MAKRFYVTTAIDFFYLFEVITIIYIDALFNYFMSKGINISDNQLRDLYLKQKLTTYQIANKLNCCQATIWKKLVKFNIARRTPYDLNSNVPSKEKLIKFYTHKKLSTWQIEKKYGYCRSTIHRKLKEFGITIRDRADSHIVHPRKDFSGDLIEKAYLVGFRIGDLGVRKIWPNSKTICVATGSTIKEQIDLVKNLFEEYGPIWIQKTKDNKMNIQINLNESFGFLLSKDFPEWVKNDKEYFFSFLAGFTDAEGWIGINKKMAIYALGNCDYRLLELIKNGLSKFGINFKRITVDKRKGKPTTGGYFFSSDYYTLRISKKGELLELLTKLKLHTRHENKIKALNIAIENIHMRNEKYGK